MSATITLRPPSTSTTSSNTTFTAPQPSWLYGTWIVTHSTLPIWRTKRNVRITYTPLPNSNAIDDLVTYQERGSDSTKVKTVKGVDTPSAHVPGAWDWRGRGWLMIASSHWEILGYGEIPANEWAVTYFAKTLFTPSGLDIYSRDPGGLPEETVTDIKAALRALGDPHIQKLVDEMFQVAS